MKSARHKSSKLVAAMLLSTVTILQSVAVAQADTVWIDSVHVEPGQGFWLPVYISCAESYTALEIPLKYDSVLKPSEVNFESSIAPLEMKTNYSIDSNALKLKIDLLPPTGGELPEILPPGGILCRIFFSTDLSTPSGRFEVDTFSDTVWVGPYPAITELSGSDRYGTSVYPKFLPGQVIVENSTDVEDPEIPDTAQTQFRLYQRSPTARDPRTWIAYSIPYDCYVALDLLNILGRRVRVLWDGPRQAGTYSIELDHREFSSGAYFCRFTADTFHMVKRLMIIK